MKYPSGRAETFYIIPDCVITVESDAFNSCENLIDITIPNSVTTIKSQAFSCDNIEMFKIPSSTTTIEKYAFLNCSALKTITVDVDNSEYCDVNGVLFTKNMKCLLAYPNSKLDMAYSVPDGVVQVEAFSNNYIKALYFPTGVNYIGSVFCDSLDLLTIPKSLERCFDVITYSKCAEIKYDGTLEDWEKLIENAEQYKKDRYSKFTIACSDGVIESDNPHLAPKDPITKENDGFIRFSAGISQETAESIKGLSAEDMGEIRSVVENISIDAPTNSGVDIQTRLYVEPKPNISSNYGNGSMAFDLSFKDENGKEIQPEKTVTVRMPVPKKLKGKDPIFVYHINDEGVAEKLEIKTEIIDGIRYVVFDAEHFSVYVVTDEEVKEGGKPDVDDKTVSVPQNVQKGDISGRVSWDPVEGADNYYIKVENTVTDKNGRKTTFVLYGDTKQYGDTEAAWVDWAFLAAPYSDEEHRIYIKAYVDGEFSDYSEPFNDNYTPPEIETIRMPANVWAENNILKWTDDVDVAGMYWFNILVNGDPVNRNIAHSNTNQCYIENLPSETYDVEMYVVDKNHITFNKKIYPVKIGKDPIDNIMIPEISYDSSLGKIIITYEDNSNPAWAFWIRIKDENGKLIRLERCTDSSYLIGELPKGEYTVDACAEVYIDHNSDLNDFSKWSPSIKLSKQDSEIDDPDSNKPNPSTPSTSKPNTSTPNTSKPNTSGSDTSEPSSGDTSETDKPANPDKPSSPSISEKGRISKDILTSDNAPKTEIKTPDDTLMEAILTVDEQEKLKNGVDVDVVLKVNAADSAVANADKTIAEEEMRKAGYKFGLCFDLKLFKTIGGEEIQIDKTNKPITISFEIPESLRSVGRKYAVIRVHNGKADILNDYDDDESTVMIHTDKFSTYVLAYSEKSGGVSGLQPSDNSGNVPGSSSGNNPYTGDNSHTTFYLVTGIASLFVFIILCLFTGNNGMTKEQKDRKFSKIIAWGKKGGKVRAAIALAVIFLLLSFYYSIGMKRSAK